MHLDFFSRYQKIRELRAATGKSDIETSSHHKAITLLKINFFQKKKSTLCRIRRKLSFDTENSEIEEKIMKSQGGHNNPLAHPCKYFWLAHRRVKNKWRMGMFIQN